MLITTVTEALLWLVILYHLAASESAAYVSPPLPDSVKANINANKDDVNRIIEHVLHGRGANVAYDRLATFGDKFGPRLAGSTALQQAINFTVQELKKDGFENVHTEPVTVPKWSRGKEWVQLIEPRSQSLPMLGLGLSVGTNNSQLEADAVIVNTFHQLQQLGGKVRGKIVVFNQRWTGYRSTVVYRRQGASEAAKLGAVAVLVRSLTSFSLATPHTGAQLYDPNVTPIPVACIAVEDAEMLDRMHRRGHRVRINMYMEARILGNTTSHNVIGEIKGSDFPDSVIIVGAHIDSWDVGTGSLDDGGGVMIAWQALYTLKQLNLRPRRTLRLVLWTAEEIGIIGGNEYFNRHKDEVNNVSLIIESDSGAMKPKGIKFSGTRMAMSILQEACSLLAVINTTTVLMSQLRDMGADTREWVKAGVPGVELYSNNEDYFHYHHTAGDTLNVLDASDLDLCTVLWATVAYVIANLDENLPRLDDVITSAASRFTIGCTDVIVVMALTSIAYCKFIRP